MPARRALGIAALGACLVGGSVLAGCGGSSQSASHAGNGGSVPVATVGSGAAAFRWLRPAPAPSSWRQASIQGGRATLSYPPQWSPITGDPGTFTAVLQTKGVFHAYVNVTPRQDGEQTHGWAAFRLNFEGREGGANVNEVAAAENLRFGGGRGSCVIDDYTARVSPHARYREIACYVVGPHASTVLIAAAPVSEWSQRSSDLERVVSVFRQS